MEGREGATPGTDIGASARGTKKADQAAEAARGRQPASTSPSRTSGQLRPRRPMHERSMSGMQPGLPAVVCGLGKQDHRGDTAVMSALSLVHDSLRIPVGELTPEHILRSGRLYKRLLIQAGITTFFGGLDASANEKDGEAAYLQIQTWVFAPTQQVQWVERTLRDLLPRTKNVPRPVTVKLWDGNLAALAYSLKNTFDRRVSYEREASDDGSRHQCCNTRDRSLRVEQEIELAITLDQVGHQARLQLGGCRVVRTSSGPMIRMIGGNQ